jgi:hypothetical protein
MVCFAATLDIRGSKVMEYASRDYDSQEQYACVLINRVLSKS